LYFIDKILNNFKNFTSVTRDCWFNSPNKQVCTFSS